MLLKRRNRKYNVHPRRETHTHIEEKWLGTLSLSPMHLQTSEIRMGRKKSTTATTAEEKKTPAKFEWVSEWESVCECECVWVCDGREDQQPNISYETSRVISGRVHFPFSFVGLNNWYFLAYKTKGCWNTTLAFSPTLGSPTKDETQTTINRWTRKVTLSPCDNYTRIFNWRLDTFPLKIR